MVRRSRAVRSENQANMTYSSLLSCRFAPHRLLQAIRVSTGEPSAVWRLRQAEPVGIEVGFAFHRAAVGRIAGREAFDAPAAVLHHVGQIVRPDVSVHCASSSRRNSTTSIRVMASASPYRCSRAAAARAANAPAYAANRSAGRSRSAFGRCVRNRPVPAARACCRAETIACASNAAARLDRCPRSGRSGRRQKMAAGRTTRRNDRLRSHGTDTAG